MKIVILIVSLFLVNPLWAGSGVKSAEIERGRYLVMVTGCNDCHTPNYGMRGGKVPEAAWLVGDRTGWKGPWGVTYASNIRSRVQGMKEQEFVKYAKAIKTRPPMPWYSLNAMTESDLIALYRYIVSLGPSDNQIPLGQAPGEKPRGPFMDTTVRTP